ncbi:MAG: cell division protein ZapA [Parvibaculales bacterium]
MGELNISINNRPFQIACADGDEHRVSRLAEELAARISDIKKSAGEAGDSRLLVLAGLTMIDEIKELQKQLNEVQQQIEASKQTKAEIDTRVQDLEKLVISGLTKATEQVQALTQEINTTAGPADVEAS